MNKLQKLGIIGGYIFVLWIVWGVGVWIRDAAVAGQKAHDIAVLEQVKMEQIPKYASAYFECLAHFYEESIIRCEENIQQIEDENASTTKTINARVDEIEKQYQ